MSDNLNNKHQLAPFEENVDTADWVTLQEEVMREPWFQFDDYDWSGQGLLDQGAEALPGEGTLSSIRSSEPHEAQNRELVPLLTAAPIGNPPMTSSASSDGGITALPQKFQCPTKGCKAKPFKRQAELQRHQLSHRTGRPTFACTAIGCSRVGAKGFFRKDKLKDHILDGHENGTEFECATGCGRQLPRDLMVVHSFSTFPEKISLRYCRDCPMPRCCFRVNVWVKSEMDDLLTHLRTKHDARGRANCAGLLLARGYSPDNVAVVCPSCETRPEFRTHDEFYGHFLDSHIPTTFRKLEFSGETVTLNRDDVRAKAAHLFHKNWYIMLAEDWLKQVPLSNEVHQHRRTILSLWPAFEEFPVWGDIKCTKRPN